MAFNGKLDADTEKLLLEAFSNANDFMDGLTAIWE